MIWTLKIWAATPSLNVTLRQHWRTRGRKQVDMFFLVAEALGKTPVPKATGKRRLVIERHGRKLLDMDNMAAGCKALVDVIKHRGLILDDNPAACELVFRQATPCLLAPFTLVTLEDIA